MMVMAEYLVAALYKFVRLPDFYTLKPKILACCAEAQVNGTLILAEEGINGTVSGPPAGVHALLALLREDPRLAALVHKESTASEAPFNRMKVHFKKEIVTMGVPGIDPSQRAGTYVKPKDWKALISDPDVAGVDTRNLHEVAIGTFAGATDPQTTNFREFPAWVQNEKETLQEKTKVAMFCTGGIRCEKATSLLLQEGFEEVYHLEGGILKYLEEIPEEDSLWEGQCFVFDQRVSVGHGLAEGDYDMCHGCRHPLTEEEKLRPEYLPGVACHRCDAQTTDEQKARFAERHKQMELAANRGEIHLGVSRPPIHKNQTPILDD